MTTVSPATTTTTTTMMSRTLRHLGLFYALAYAGMLALTLPFLDPTRAYPEWLTLVGRWVPALASLAALALMGPNALRRVVHWWSLGAGGWRCLLAGIATSVGALLVVAFVPVLVGQTLGWIQLKPWALVGGALALLPVYLVAGSLSTLGEEVAWRGFLPRLLERLDFWSLACVVAGLWALWHVPQLAMFVTRGDMPLREAAAVVIGIAFWSVALTALSARFGSVWPAVVGHALPFRAGSLVVSQPAGTLQFWTLVALECALYLALAVALVRGHRSG